MGKIEVEMLGASVRGQLVPQKERSMTLVELMIARSRGPTDFVHQSPTRYEQRTNLSQR